MEVDVLIFGGGIAGLWTLDGLTRREYNTILVENDYLGSGQTIVSQGIIHGGFKYILPRENRKDSAKELSNIPSIWRNFLYGKQSPDLSDKVLKSEYCYLWSPRSKKKIKSFMDSIALKLGSKFLSTCPKKVNQHNVPQWLVQSASEIYELREPIVDPSRLLYNLAKPHSKKILYTEKSNMQFGSNKTEREYAGRFYFKNRFNGKNLEITAKTIILSAGKGNSELLKKLGLTEEITQEKPVRHLFVKGNMPEFYGHCIEGGRTEITITTHKDSNGNYIWNIGAGSGGIGDKGIKMSREDFIHYGKKEISRTLQALNISETEWSTFDAVKVEHLTKGRKRPTGSIVQKINNVIFGWPTKLALAPMFLSRVLELMPEPTGLKQVSLDTYVEPQIAKAPWEI